jgi:OOP family OmpA-OmpF porin
MAKTTRWLLSSIAVLALTTSVVQAQEWESGLYLEAGGGISLLSDLETTRSGIRADIESDMGFILSAAIGLQFSNVHTEIEALWFENNFNHVCLSGTCPDIGGDLSTIGGMGNVYYDFDFGKNWRPFLGGGVGLMRVDISNANAPGFVSVDDDDWAIAYQLKAGISYSLGSHADFVIGYRYMMTDDLDISDVTGGTLSTDGIDSHGIEARLRIRY